MDRNGQETDHGSNWTFFKLSGVGGGFVGKGESTLALERSSGVGPRKWWENVSLPALQKSIVSFSLCLVIWH